MSHGLESKQETLGKTVGKLGFFSLAFGSMIGVGWVIALGGWLTDAGPVGAALAFAAGGGLMIAIGLCYAEITPMLPVAGGEVAYSYKSFGTSKAFIVGWFLTFGYLAVSAFEALSVAKVAGFIFPETFYEEGEPVTWLWIAVALAGTTLISWINYTGTKNAARLQTVLTLSFLAVIIAFIIASMSSGNLDNLKPEFGTALEGNYWTGILGVFVTVPFWFVGFDTIPQSAEEAGSKVSPRSLGMLIILAIGGAVVFYIAIIFGAAMVGSREAVTGSSLAAGKAFELAFRSESAATLAAVAAMLGLLTSWNGFFLAGTRVLFSLGRGRIISPLLSATHPKRHSPTNAVLFSAAVTAVASLAGPAAMGLYINFGSFCIVVAFLGVALSFYKLRDKYPDSPRPYRLRFGKTIAGIAIAGTLFMLGVMIIPGTGAALGMAEWLTVGGVSIAGGLFWLASKKQRREVTEAERDELILGKYKD